MIIYRPLPLKNPRSLSCDRLCRAGNGHSLEISGCLEASARCGARSCSHYRRSFRVLHLEEPVGQWLPRFEIQDEMRERVTIKLHIRTFLEVDNAD